MADRAGPWDRLIGAADAWDQSGDTGLVDPVGNLCDPLAAMLRRQAAKSAMYGFDLTSKGVPWPIVEMVIESDSDFMVADAAGKALRTLLS